ncbi:MAG TPA: cytochrome P450 [Candidatus Binatia bacterium]|nr:cytochrome P450 [Candidatus Binatia bacterium]
MRIVRAARDAGAVPPGPAMAPVFQVLRWLRHPIEFMEECAATYGDCFTLRLAASPPLVFFSHPNAVREILTGDDDEMRAGEANFSVAPVLGQHSLLVLDGPRHRHTRRLMLPPFHGERMHAYGDTICAIADAAIDRWPLGVPFPIHPEMQAITLDAIMQTVFGLDGSRHLPALRGLLLELLRCTATPLMRLPWTRRDRRPKPWSEAVRLKRELDALLVDEVASRRGIGWPGREDVLGMLIDARDESGRPLSDADLCDELMTLLVAGHETTATSLAWIVSRLLNHPEVLDRLRAELADAARGGALTPERVRELPYLDAAIKETLRLDPVFAVVGRRLTRPTRIGGHALPAGVIVTPCIYLTHRRPDVWPDPERFDPSRFLGVRPSPYEFLPFGGGMRRCLGMAFAVYEMQLVVARLVSRTVLRLAVDAPARTVRRNITLAPAGGVPVVLESRVG